MDALKLRLRLLGQLVVPAIVLLLFCLEWVITWLVVAFLVACVPQSRWPARRRWARFQTVINFPGRVWLDRYMT